MATFTMYLWEVLDSLYGDSMDPDDYEQMYDTVTVNGITYGKLPVLDDYEPIGLGFYPVFEEDYRRVINGKILDRYWNDEIGQETIEIFVHNLRRTMDQIMPYYNQLYATEALTFDNALKTMDIHSVGTNKMEATEKAKSLNTTDSKNKTGSRATNLNFPQTALAGDADYASSAVETNSNGSVDGKSEQENEGTTNSESNSDNRVTGYQGNLNNLVAAFRANVINIDLMILNDPQMKDCFMLLHNNGDEYTTSESRNGWY